ncbi:MAG: hypothetical protein O2901_16205 [Verrucomicrobia bacterium]|nr:hypothetical protein [Verrucomicrobiota bacterium]
MVPAPIALRQSASRRLIGFRCALFGLTWICFACGVRAQTDDEPSPLVRAQTQYKNAVADIRTAAEEARAKTFTKYGKTLEHLAETYQKRGYLDALLAVKKEIERFKRDAYIPADPPPGLPTLLEKTQTQVHVALADIDLDRALSVIRLTGDYITHLDTLMRRLTTEGKLEEAVAVRDAIASAKQAPAYTAALFEKAALELSTSTDAEDKQNPSQRDALQFPPARAGASP